MPSDSNGVYSLPDGYEAVTGEIIQASQHNPPLEDLESAMSARLMRSGVAPMTGPLKASDGSVGSPSLTFNSATSSGLYKTTSGIGVSIGGTKVAEFTSSGVSRMLGELIPWTRLSAPSGWVLPYGQTLSRTTYADLWAIAQTEIAGGNTFYNNGDGTTTFGIGDLRGRVIAAYDGMGGSAANRLTTSTMSTGALGGTGGAQTNTIAQANLPNVNLSSASLSATTSLSNNSAVHRGSSASGQFQSQIGGTTAYTATDIAVNNIGANTTISGVVPLGGSGAAMSNVQPTIICNYILYAGA